MDNIYMVQFTWVKRNIRNSPQVTYTYPQGTCCLLVWIRKSGLDESLTSYSCWDLGWCGLILLLIKLLSSFAPALYFPQSRRESPRERFEMKMDNQFLSFNGDKKIRVCLPSFFLLKSSFNYKIKNKNLKIKVKFIC